MASDTAMSSLHLVSLPVDPVALAAFAVAEELSDDDSGYALHTALRRRFGSAAPQPFRLLGAEGSSTLLGYVPDAQALDEAAGLPAVDPMIDRIFPQAPQCKPMPATWRRGQRLAFEVRARPLVRYGARARAARAAAGKRGAGERDAFLAAIESAPAEQHVDRELVYRQWLDGTVRGAADLSSVRVAAMRRLRVRRSVHTPGETTVFEGYDVVFRGVLEVQEPDAFMRLLARGVGRHAAFGFGMLLLRPVGRT